MEKIALINHGCAKNLIDSELMLGLLIEAGYEITLDDSKSDIIIVNTCSFIHDAEEESVKSILEMIGEGKKVIITGCLPQKHKKELQKAIPEAVAFLGTSDYDKIVEIITSNKTNKISGVKDYRICGQTSFMYGLYNESIIYYQKVISINKKILSEQDLSNYAFSLLRQGKGDELLSNPIFKGNNENKPWIIHLQNIAKSQAVYNLRKDSLVTSKDLTMEFLSQYGLDYFDNHIYYSYSRYSGEKKGDLFESSLMNDRRNELAGIKKGRIGANGKLLSPVVIKKALNGSGRIASMNVTDKNENYFATIVPRKGKPEQIVIHGDLYPPFPYNSTKYANAMPYFDKLCQRLYYCSNMTGGIGGWDIYYTELKNGQWGVRVNLGPKVNTPFDELFPSVYKDLLVFSSEAQEGLGGFDNYVYSLTTGRLENLWPFNTSGDDLSFRIIQSSPLKAIGVNVPNAKYYVSGDDLEYILNPTKRKPVEKPAIKEEVVEQPIALVEPPKEVEQQTLVIEPAAPLVEMPKEKVEEPIAVVEPVKEIIETPIVAVEPAAPAVEVPTEKVEEPIAIVEPVKEIVEHPVVVVEPPTPIVEEPKKVEELPLVLVEPIKDNKEVIKDEITNPKKIIVDTLPDMVIPSSLSGESPKTEEQAIIDPKTGDVLLGNLYYDLNSAVFKSTHYAVLDSVVKKIKEQDCKNIIVWSFTDRVGAERYNGNLAFQRALGVVEYLKSKFQDSENKVYFTVAAGEYFANTTRETNAVDRRAEIYSSKKGLPFNIVYAFKPSKWESAESIAKVFNNNFDSMKELNQNTPENRISDQIIYVGIQGIHVISPGETIFRLSQKYRCTVEQLLKANHKANFDISVGEKLVIPLPLSN